MLSLVIPVYRNQESIPDLLVALERVDATLDHDFEVVFVIDGSPDRSLEILGAALPNARFRSTTVVLSRNFGSFAAIAAGLQEGRGEMFAVMAADLQEPPELVQVFRDRLRTGDCDVVVGKRARRDDPLGTRLASRLFWGLYRRLIQKEIPSGGVDVFACTREFRDHLLALGERNSSLVGLVFWLGFRRTEVEYVRRPRAHGQSAWSFWRKIRYLLDSTFAFSDLPVRALSVLGFAGIFLSLFLGVVVVVLKARGGISVPGYAATVLVVMFFGGINSAGLGILGEYLWRTFENTKGRPNYVVARVLKSDDSSVEGNRG